MTLILLLAWYLLSRQRQRRRAESQGKAQEKKQRVVEIMDREISMYEVHGESMPMELQGIPRAESIGDTGALEK